MNAPCSQHLNANVVTCAPCYFILSSPSFPHPWICFEANPRYLTRSLLFIVCLNYEYSNFVTTTMPWLFSSELKIGNSLSQSQSVSLNQDANKGLSWQSVKSPLIYRHFYPSHFYFFLTVLSVKTPRYM